MSSTTLVISNDFPPRLGGIEAFVRSVCRALDEDVVVLTSREPGSQSYDAGLPFDVVRQDRILLPMPRVARTATALIQRHDIRRVLFGAAAPLGLLAPRLRAAGAERVLGLTHGHETWWAHVPLARSLLRRIGDSCDHLGYISGYTLDHLADGLSPAARTALLRIPPPYDERLFRIQPRDAPSQGLAPQGSAVEPSALAGARLGEVRGPRGVAVGRFVARKGFDLLLDAWPAVLAGWTGGLPQPQLVLIGDGPERSALERRCARLGLTEVIRFTGALPPSAVAAELRLADVFAFPVRPRLRGLDSEGLGLAVIEAAACGLPVVVARSGGAPDTVLDGRTGLLIEPDNPRHLAAALLRLFTDPVLARRMGAAGAAYVAGSFSHSAVRDAVRTALALP